MKLKSFLVPVFILIIKTGAAQTNIYQLNSNVGIGRTDPSAPLHIQSLIGDSKPAGVSAITTPILKFGRNGTFNYSYNEAAEFRIGHGGPSASGSQLDLYLNGASNQTENPDQQVMTWLYNGNVGIGTTTPTAKLEVISSSNNNQLTLSKNTIVGEEGAGVVFKNMINDGSIPEIGGIQAKLLSGTVGAVAGSLSLYTKYNSSKIEAVTINPVGNVGIGTTTPLERLSVNGNIRAREIKVTASEWPDYVFDEDYKTLSLSELENFIKMNKHLPDIPTAREAQTDGIELGDMNKKLLKKIEELTLYLLESDKEIKMLKKSNKRIDQLERKLQELINHH